MRVDTRRMFSSCWQTIGKIWKEKRAKSLLEKKDFVPGLLPTTGTKNTSERVLWKRKRKKSLEKRQSQSLMFITLSLSLTLSSAPLLSVVRSVWLTSKTDSTENQLHLLYTSFCWKDMREEGRSLADCPLGFSFSLLSLSSLNLLSLLLLQSVVAVIVVFSMCFSAVVVWLLRLALKLHSVCLLLHYTSLHVLLRPWFWVERKRERERFMSRLFAPTPGKTQSQSAPNVTLFFM